MGHSVHSAGRNVTVAIDISSRGDRTMGKAVAARRPLQSKRWLLRIALLVLVRALSPTPAWADPPSSLPSPLRPADVVRYAKDRRAEVSASKWRAYAARQRPAVVSALPDPMVMGAIDHLPFSFKGADLSLSVQQEFPFSRVRTHRRHAAEAEADRSVAETARVTLEVEAEALDAYFSLAERRGMAVILDEQIELVNEIVIFARSHYAAGQGTEADVLRPENEAARMRAERLALTSESRAAEATLNTALAREVSASVPELGWDDPGDPPALAVLVNEGLAARPELQVIRAERARADAEIKSAESAYSPVGFLRAGPSYTMTEGMGMMAMLGVSVPIWRSRLAAGVRDAQATSSAAQSELIATQRAVLGEIASSREGVVAQRARLVAIQVEILPRARRVVTSSIGAFASGQYQMIGVLEAARDLRSVRIEELAARIRLGMAWSRLQRATGRLDALAAQGRPAQGESR